MEEILKKIKSDPEFTADLREFGERIRYSNESEKNFSIFKVFAIRRNTRALEELGRKMFPRMKEKYNLGQEEIKSVVKHFYNEG